MADIHVDAASAGLTDEQIAELGSFGTARDVAAGEVLYEAGDDAYDFFVVLAGEVDIVRPSSDGETEVVSHGAGHFLGELNMLTGQRVYLTARMKTDGRVLAVEPVRFRRMMSAKPDISRRRLPRVRQPPRPPADRRRCGRDPHHRLAFLAGSDGAAHVRGRARACRTRGSTSKTTPTRPSCSPASARGRRTRPSS